MSLQSVTITLTISEREGGGIRIGGHGEYADVYIAGERTKVLAALDKILDLAQEVVALGKAHGRQIEERSDTEVPAAGCSPDTNKTTRG